MARVIFSWRLWVLLPFVLLAAIMLWARLAPRPKHLGVTEGRLAPCPDRPNCVCSQADDAEHAIDPLPLSGTAAASLQQIKDIVQAMPGARLGRSEHRYLHVEFRSRLMGYVDDCEFYADDQARVVQIRSASRLGHSDFGVNRDRMERIRAAYLDRIKGRATEFSAES